MKVFVFEYVCGGGWPAGRLSQSLATEGGAMLRALCEDLSGLPDVDVTTTRDTRIPLRLPSAVHVIDVDSPSRGQEELLHQAIRADVCIVIAPELENILARCIRELREAGANVIAPPDGWIEHFSDKRRLLLHGIRMIPTYSLEQHTPHDLNSEFAVIKPAFGAGSQSISVVPTEGIERLRSPPDTPPLEQLIVQPYVPGQAVSVGAISNSIGETVILPVAQQILSDDGYLQYLGGRVPWTRPAAEPIQQIIRRCCEQIPELVGYIGFDFVVPEVHPEEPLLVEINPRMCTSYLGYRRLADDNLAARMLPNWPKSPIRWKNEAVRFQPDGVFEVMSLPEDQPCV